MVNAGPNYRFEPDTIGRTDDFEMISITVSDSSPRQYVLMLVETDKLSRVTLIAVGTNQNRFTASAAPQRQPSALCYLLKPWVRSTEKNLER